MERISFPRLNSASKSAHRAARRQIRAAVDLPNETGDVEARADQAALPGVPTALDGLDSFYRRQGKRALDLTLGLSLLLVLTPAIIVLSFLVVFTSGWPPFYVSERIGRGGRPFRMLKFRTMIRDADAVLARWRETRPTLAEAFEEQFKLKDDPRVTAFGRLLRRSSLDELPQLWNVLRGDMSLVGVRPIVFEELAKYGSEVTAILSARPGLTGAWQINGRNQIGYPQRKWIEVDYCRSATFLGDLAILALTLAVPFRYDGL